MTDKRVGIIGGGIVGLAIAYKLSLQGYKVTLFEKESTWGFHQTGHNSGVIHAGPYYKPGSLKAKMCLAGNKSMFEFAEKYDIPHSRCGKLIVASDDKEVDRLKQLASRAQQNGVDCELITPGQAAEFEPHVFSKLALRVENTGIIDYKAVSNKLAELAQELGADLKLNSEVFSIQASGNNVQIVHNNGTDNFDFMINAAGLYSDKIAKLAGFSPTVRIVPFRGEYFELTEEKNYLVKGLIYPVPDPDLPFLGVHLTKMIDGSVHAGPNAVLAFAREGYRWKNISLLETFDTLSYPGFLKLGMNNISTGLREIVRSASKQLFAHDLAKLVPEISKKDIIPSGSGVRAQAVNTNGSLADDFVIQKNRNQIHILNAPSPAATSSLEIGNYIAEVLNEMAR